MFRVNVPDAPGLRPTKKADPDIDTTQQPGKKLTTEDDVKKIDFGDEADSESQRKKRKGAEDLAIKLQAPEKKTGGLGGLD
jgi:hypothetical protein